MIIALFQSNKSMEVYMNKRMLTVLLILIICLTIPALLFAGGEKEGKEESAAKWVTVYASVDEANAKKILDAFTEDTGIDVAFVHLSSGPAFSRIQAESKNPQADVWLGAPSENHIMAKEAGLTIPYISEASEKLDSDFKDPDGYWRCFYMNPMAFGVNTEALEKAGAPKPTSWADLTKPVYKDLIQAPTPQASGTAYNALTSLVTMMGEDEALRIWRNSTTTSRLIRHPEPALRKESPLDNAQSESSLLPLSFSLLMRAILWK